ncbi:MAG: PhzF family phenazine biosynthesis protein [Hyphomicrobiales bacterium]
MHISNTIVAAFVGDGLDGNLAGVCPLSDWLPDATMQAIAAFNDLPETAFVLLRPEGHKIRWFTPTTEVRMCGHATLASAFVLRQRLGHMDARFRFGTAFGQDLFVTAGDEFITLDFPAGALAPSASDVPARALGVEPEETLLGESWVCRLRDEAAVRTFEPDFDAIAAVPEDGIIITAPGDACDFVSRYFVPQAGIPEDPVTGYAHTLLVPYWAARLGKQELHAMQVSSAGGELFCRLDGDRVHMRGRARLVSESEISIDGAEVVGATV